MKLAAYRKLRGITPGQAACELLVSLVTYWRWESKGIVPRPKKIQAIFDWSNGAVTAADLMEKHQCKQE